MFAGEVLVLPIRKGMSYMGVGQYETNTEMVVFEGVEDDGARIVVVDPPVATKVPEPVYIVSGRQK